MSVGLIMTEIPRPPRFLAIRQNGSRAAAAVAEKYRTLCGLRTDTLMAIIRFNQPDDLTMRVADENGTLDEVVLMYPRPGTTSVWYTQHQPNPSAPEVLWVQWRWAVGINPNLHDPRKIKDLEQAAKSIRHTYGSNNFILAHQQNRVPWGNHGRDIVEQIRTGAVSAGDYFRSAFSQSSTLGGWNHASME